MNYDIRPRVRVFAGYEVLFWNDVVRPGNQINRTINSNANSNFLFGLQTDVKAQGTRPAPLFNTSDFWAQGVSFGLEFRY